MSFTVNVKRTKFRWSNHFLLFSTGTRRRLPIFPVWPWPACAGLTDSEATNDFFPVWWADLLRYWHLCHPIRFCLVGALVRIDVPARLSKRRVLHHAQQPILGVQSGVWIRGGRGVTKAPPTAGRTPITWCLGDLSVYAKKRGDRVAGKCLYLFVLFCKPHRVFFF